MSSLLFKKKSTMTILSKIFCYLWIVLTILYGVSLIHLTKWLFVCDIIYAIINFFAGVGLVILLREERKNKKEVENEL